jgi:hypothetical protein
MSAAIIAIALAIACARIGPWLTEDAEWRDENGWNGWSTRPTFDEELKVSPFPGAETRPTRAEWQKNMPLADFAAWPRVPLPARPVAPADQGTTPGQPQPCFDHAHPVEVPHA